MTTIPDLSPCHYFIDSHDVLAIGWLGANAPYRQGEVDEAVFTKLVELLVDPWSPGKWMGSHQCELCRFSGGPSSVTYRKMSVSIGSRDLFVPSGNILYAAPSSIVHYIDAHSYAPPAEFCAAVLACAPMRSAEYRMALLRSSPAFVEKYIKRQTATK